VTTSRIVKLVSKETRTLVERYQKLQEIATALSEEQDLGRLLNVILRESRALTAADSGSVYVREDITEQNPEATGKDTTIHRVTSSLVLKITQNDSIAFPFKELRLPFDKKTVAGYVAVSGEVLNIVDAYNLPDGVPFSYNRDFDVTSGYRCKSMLVIPMRNRAGDVIGAIQLINKKKDAATRLATKDDVERNVTVFDPFDEELALALGSQAAVCVEKAKLYEEIEAMFEGLVSSFTIALEKRNRTTYGHCLRVAKYAVAIAEAINDAPPGAFGVRYSKEQIRELRYAALLHDIGKIAVPEAVLDKRNKLLDSEIEAIGWRIAYWKERLAREGKPNGHLDGWAEHVRKVNVPRGTTDADVKVLSEIAATLFTDVDGTQKPLLTPREFENLSIQRGNLTKDERKQIEQHIVDTWEVLKKVPWPRMLRAVPNIASCHHERPNGTGYPWKLKAEEIPLGGRILAIVDIYEALTAKDRPYKPAIPVEKALAILDEEAARGAVDAKIYQLFKDRRIFMMFMDETGFVHRPSVPQVQ
jgi:HD-GYP domain-containing protein (c-di-GMP phosphodiesterase class II)